MTTSSSPTRGDGADERAQHRAAIHHHGVARTYDRLASLYDLVFGRVLEPGRRRMAAHVNALQPAALLEVGVGTGLALEGYPTASRIVGVDVSGDMLQRARERARRLPLHDIAIAQMDAEHMQFADDTFDCVTMPYVLSVTPDPAALVREVRRVCKPDGTILLLNHFNGSRCWWLLEQAARPLARQVGFRSDFRYEAQVLAHDWQVRGVESVNLLGLSRLVVLGNGKSP